jgi:transcription antitermination factor NusG
MQFSTTNQQGRLLTEPAWFAVYTKHQHEKKAAELLTTKGIETYVPLYKATHRWKDRTKNLLLPLFPGYIFICSQLHDKAAILNTPGVFFLVESAGRACPIAGSEIDAIRRITASQAKVQPHPFLESGDSVRVLNGPLAGIEGILVRWKNQYRMVLSVKLLKRSLAIEIDVSNVEKSRAMPGGADDSLLALQRTA